MREINGKLLGESSGNSNNEAATKEHFKVLYQNINEQKGNLQKFRSTISNLERQVDHNKTDRTEMQEAVLATVKNHLLRLEQRCDRLEAAPQESVQQLKHSIEQQSYRLSYLEARKMAKVQQKLSELETQDSTHLVWIAIISSMAVGSLSIFNYLNWRQFNLESDRQPSQELYLQAESNSRPRSNSTQ